MSIFTPLHALPPTPPPVPGMLVYRRITPSIKFADTHLYTWVERGTVRVKCLAQEHNSMYPAGQARTQTAQSERTNHEATAPHKALFSIRGQNNSETMTEPLKKIKEEIKISKIRLAGKARLPIQWNYDSCNPRFFIPSPPPITPSKMIFFPLSSTLQI